MWSKLISLPHFQQFPDLCLPRFQLGNVIFVNVANDIEGQIRANADKLYASRRPAGKGAAAKAEEPAKAADAKEPVVKAPARSSESELDIMVED